MRVMVDGPKQVALAAHELKPANASISLKSSAKATSPLRVVSTEPKLSAAQPRPKAANGPIEFPMDDDFHEM
jgi:hypothetical protein